MNPLHKHTLLKQDDGSELFVSAEADAVELFFAEGRRVQSLSLEPATALRLAWFLLWSWWARHLVFGLRLRAWGRSVLQPPDTRAPAGLQSTNQP